MSDSSTVSVLPSSERSYGGREHEVRVRERRECFIQAGIRLFGTIGYHATTVRILCAEAGLSNRYFYESFVSTEALLIAVYKTLMSQCQERISSVMFESLGEFNLMVTSAVRVFFECALDPLFARTTLVEVLGVSADVDEMYMDNTRQFGQMIVAGAQSLLDKSTMSEAELEMLGVSLVGALAYAALHWMRSGYQLSVEQMVNNAVRIITGLADGLAKS